MGRQPSPPRQRPNMPFPSFGGGGGGGGSGAPSRSGRAALLSEHAWGGPLTVAALATDTTLTVAPSDVSAEAVGYYFDVGILVTAVDTETGVMTLDGAVATNASIGTEVSVIPLAGAGARLTLPGALAGPTEIKFWGYWGNDFCCSTGLWASAESYSYHAWSGSGVRSGSRAPGDTYARIGAFISRNASTFGELIYDPADHSIRLDPDYAGSTVPYIFGIIVTT